MTKRDLLNLLADFPDDTPVLDGRGFDLHASSINETTCDDWGHATEEIIDGAVYETPAVARAIAIGRRF